MFVRCHYKHIPTYFSQYVENIRVIRLLLPTVLSAQMHWWARFSRVPLFRELRNVFKLLASIDCFCLQVSFDSELMRFSFVHYWHVERYFFYHEIRGVLSILLKPHGNCTWLTWSQTERNVFFTVLVSWNVYTMRIFFLIRHIEAYLRLHYLILSFAFSI